MFNEDEYLKSLYGDLPLNGLIITGHLPPPLGGVSVFCDRLTHLLDKKGIRYRFLKCRLSFFGKMINYFLFAWYIIAGSCRTIHFNESTGAVYLCMIRILGRIYRLRIILMVHNNHSVQRAKRELPYLSYIIIVGKSIMPELKKINIPENLPVIVQNAFIPPYRDEMGLTASLEREVHDFAMNHKPLIISSASRIVFKNGTDLYGIDMCIELARRIKTRFSGTGFILALADASSNSDYLMKVRDDIERYSLGDNFYFLINNAEYWPLLKKADLFIRATYKDGYGISIDEALYFGCPVLASDCCIRHPRAMLFRNRDMDDLEKKTIKILTQGRPG